MSSVSDTGEELQFVVPSDFAPGTYDLTVLNPENPDLVVTLQDALTVQ